MNFIKTGNDIFIVHGLKVFEYFDGGGGGTKFYYSPEETKFNHHETN